ncbi:MAG: hypothetical protein JWM96_971 [Alphaproteobacteria bacterium]|nr:hypothetical protein [Alphaproteobacteria bacterium]
MVFYQKFNKAAIQFLFLPVVLGLLPLAIFSACAGVLYPVYIHTDKGPQMFQVEYVHTPEDMARGLMYRKSLAADRGMFFLFEGEEPRSFWMKNTLIPLDIIFITKHGKIATIQEMAKPLDETAIPSKVPVMAVLEIAGGQAAKRGIKVGDKVETSLLPGQNEEAIDPRAPPAEQK